MSLEFEEPAKTKRERGVDKKVREYEKEFRTLIADEVWGYLDRAGIRVDTFTEKEIDEAIESRAAELAEAFAEKVRSVNKMLSNVAGIRSNLEAIRNGVLVAASTIESTVEHASGSLRSDLSEVAKELREAVGNIERSIEKIKNMLKKANEYLEELEEEEMERMAREAADEILERFGF